MLTKIFALTLAFLTVTAPARAATITWDVNATSLSPTPGSVTGSFVFNSLLQNITDFNISVTGFGGTPFTLNPSNAQAFFGNNSVLYNAGLAPAVTVLDFTNLTPPDRKSTRLNSSH